MTKAMGLLVFGFLVGASPSNGANLLSNGDAEIGTTVDWSIVGPVASVVSYNDFTGTVSPQGGARFFSSVGTPTAASFASMIQTGTTGLAPGSPLILSGWVQTHDIGRNQGDPDDDGEAIVRIFDSLDQLLVEETTGSLLTARFVWEMFNVCVAVPPGAARWEVELRGTLRFGCCINVHYDTVTLDLCEGVPTEPTTWSAIKALYR